MSNKDNSSSKDIVVISGPSGCGKSTIIHRLIAIHPEIVFSTSHTTRSIRPREIDGKDYHFISKEQFMKMKDEGEFVEWAEVYGNYYGTGYREIERKIAPGSNRVLMLDIDVQGARNIRKKYPGGLFIFVVPPSLEELRTRLVKREKVVDFHIQKRLAVAIEELQQYDIYDYVVINDKLDEAFAITDSIYIAFRNRTAKHEAFIKKLLSGQGGEL